MPKAISRRYLEDNVLEAAKKRMALIFDHFDNIVVSASSGKDSTVLYWLAIEEAIKRNRKIKVFFLDQEAEYQASIDLIREMMSHPVIEPMWYQVPLYMTNAVGYEVDQLYAWGEGQDWMRSKDPIAIHSINGAYPQRFYPFFEWMEGQQPNGTAFLVGLRAGESLNRFRAVIKNPSFQGIPWSSKTCREHSHKFYPIYDWGTGDVWRYIYTTNRAYNRIYDLMYQKNSNFYNTMRVSYLAHEKSFKCLTDLQEMEPATYAALLKRLPGAHLASIYGKDAVVFNARKLPTSFATWKEYRDHLLATIPTDKRHRFADRFNGQPDIDHYHRQQCRQLMTNDWENSLSTTKPKKTDWKDKWKLIL